MLTVLIFAGNCVLWVLTGHFYMEHLLSPLVILSGIVELFAETVFLGIIHEVLK